MDCLTCRAIQWYKVTASTCSRGWPRWDVIGYCGHRAGTDGFQTAVNSNAAQQAAELGPTGVRHDLIGWRPVTRVTWPTDDHQVQNAWRVTQLLISPTTTTTTIIIIIIIIIINTDHELITKHESRWWSSGWWADGNFSAITLLRTWHITTRTITTSPRLPSL